MSITVGGTNGRRGGHRVSAHVPTADASIQDFGVRMLAVYERHSKEWSLVEEARMLEERAMDRVVGMVDRAQEEGLSNTRGWRNDILPRAAFSSLGDADKDLLRREGRRRRR